MKNCFQELAAFKHSYLDCKESMSLLYDFAANLVLLHDRRIWANLDFFVYVLKVKTTHCMLGAIKNGFKSWC